MFFMSRRRQNILRLRQRRQIINIASGAFLPWRHSRSVFMSCRKVGVMGITRLMANEWAKHNINVNAIAPGYMVHTNTAPAIAR
ncbi:SDR family oxidoreductase [Salmonella enterica subsp. enterica]|nr:SDR family oxidoreductase [Salmonella enterica subsp. enterica]